MLTMHIDRLAIHPIKGFPPCPVTHVTAVRDHGILGDRQFAITHARSRFEPGKSDWMARKNFLNVAHCPALAALEAVYDLDARRFSARRQGESVIGHLLAEGPVSVELGEMLEQGVAGSHPPPYRLVAPTGGFSLTDSFREGVSILNLSSLQDLSAWLQTDLEPGRFRANAWVSGASAWEEQKWPGRRLTIGDCVLEVLENIERCAAVDTAPGQGTRDVKVVKALRERTGNIHFGVLAVVVKGGRIATGDQIVLDTKL